MFKSFFKSELTQNVSILFSSNVIGQGIAFLVYILLTRMYDAVDFGIFAVFSSVTGLLSILATGGYEKAFIISKEKKSFFSILGFTLKLLIIFSFFVFLILLLFKNSLFHIFRIESLGRYWYMIPLTIFVTGLFSILTNVANREKQFKTIAISNISLNTLCSGLKIGGFYIFRNATGLIYANFFGQLLACFSFYNLRKSLKTAWLYKWKDQKDAAVKYKAFPSYDLTRSFINSFSGNLPFLLLAGFFGEALLGLFTLALTLIFRPINLLSSSLYRVFYERFSHLQHLNQKISPSLYKYWRILFLFGIPCSIIIFVCAPAIFKFVFPENWSGSVIFFQILIPWMFFVLASTPFAFIPILFKKQHLSFIFEIFYLIIRFLALAIGILFENFQLAILLFSLTGMCFMVIISIWYLSMIKKYEKSLNND